MKWQAARARPPIWHPFAPSGIDPRWLTMSAPRDKVTGPRPGAAWRSCPRRSHGVRPVGKRLAGKHKDHRYYELVEDTIQPDLVFRYFAIKDEDGSVCAFQPFFAFGALARTHAERQDPTEILQLRGPLGATTPLSHTIGCSHASAPPCITCVPRKAFRDARAASAKSYVRAEHLFRFSSQPRPDRLANLCVLNCDLTKRLFYCAWALPRFLHSQDPKAACSGRATSCTRTH